MEVLTVVSALFLGGGAAPLIDDPDSRLDTLCNHMLSKTPEGPGSVNTHRYQTLIYRVSGVSDDEQNWDVIRSKVQAWWSGGGWKYTCPGTNVHGGGSILKFAVDRNFDEFINDATVLWDLDPNYWDASDGRTVLDYVDDEVFRYKGTGIEPTLRRYYNQFAAGGAKHRVALDGIECRKYPLGRADRRCAPWTQVQLPASVRNLQLGDGPPIHNVDVKFTSDKSGHILSYQVGNVRCQIIVDAKTAKYVGPPPSSLAPECRLPR